MAFKETVRERESEREAWAKITEVMQRMQKIELIGYRTFLRGKKVSWTEKCPILDKNKGSRCSKKEAPDLAEQEKLTVII